MWITPPLHHDILHCERINQNTCTSLRAFCQSHLPHHPERLCFDTSESWGWEGLWMASKSHCLSHWLGSWMSARLCRHTELSETRRISQRDREHICLSMRDWDYDYDWEIYVAITFGCIIVRTSLWGYINTYQQNVMRCVKKSFGKLDHNHLIIHDVNSFKQFWKALPH